MPPLAGTGSNSSLSYGPETLFGVIPAAPAMKYVRAKTGFKFDLKRDTFSSKEQSPTRQITGLTYGNRSGSGEIPFEFSYASFDDFIEAVFGGTWAGDVLKIGSVKRSFVFETAQPDINLFEQNTGCVFSSFNLSVKPNGVVEGSFSLVNKDQLCTQMASDGTTTIAFAATTMTRSVGSFITDGFAIGDIVMVSGGSVGVNNKLVTLTAVAATVLTAAAAAFTVDAAKTGVTIAKTLSLAPTATNSNPVYDSFTGVMTEAGVTCAIVTGIDIKVEQSANGSNVLFDATIQQVSLGTVIVTGSVSVRFINNNLKKKFLSGTQTDLSFTLGSGAGGGKSEKFDMSSVNFTSASTDTGEGELNQTFAFQATYNAGDASSIMLTRIP